MGGGKEVKKKEKSGAKTVQSTSQSLLNLYESIRPFCQYNKLQAIDLYLPLPYEFWKFHSI